MNEDLARRSVNSVKWNAIANGVQTVLSFVQSIFLARLLPIETFGVYAGAASVVVLTGGISNFGLAGAFTYRCVETEDLDRTAAIHFTLQLILNIIWTSVMLFGGLLFIKPTGDGYLTAYIVLTLTKTAANFTNTPRFMLSRLVQFQRLALITIVDVIFTFILACLLAFWNQPLWALLVTNLISVFVNYVFLYVWRPVWRPKLMWSTSTMKYFLGFGSKQVLARFLMDALDRVDELWTKSYLGSVPLGFYSKAYSFALYPGKVLADPVSNVAISTYAEISNDRKALSDAFYRTNSLLIRTGFYLVGLLTLIAPEFIRIFIGERWMPMMLTFRLMLPFTLFDPMKKTMSNLFIAVGKPGIIVQIRIIQLAVMVIGLFSFGNLLGIEGVAIAVDLMMLSGIVMILRQAKEYVDFSIKRFFNIPFLALITGLVVGFGFDYLYAGRTSDIVSGFIKIISFSVLYIGMLFLFDRKDMISVYLMAKKYIFKHIFD